MAVLQDININVHGQPSEKRLQTFLRLSQNENGRMINFRVLGAPLPSNCTATFSGTKPDGNVYSKAGTVTGNFVVIEEDIQMTAVAGVWDAKLDIINGAHNIMTALIRVVVDADVVDPDAIASDSQLQGLVAEAKYYAEHARTDAYGSPLTAPTKAQMTDHTRVYVYTGSEPNMVAGNWYLWNGSAWVSGGVYNAVAVQTDTTLSVAGKAADGKATGDAVASLKEDLKSAIDAIDKQLDTGIEIPHANWAVGGLWTSSGHYNSEVTNRVATVDMFTVDENKTFTIDSGWQVGVATLDDTDTLIESIVWKRNEVTLDTGKNYRLVIVASPEPSVATVDEFVRHIHRVSNIQIQINALSEGDASLQAQVNAINQTIKTGYRIIGSDSFEQGSFNSAGLTSNTTTRIRPNALIPVDVGSKIQIIPNGQQYAVGLWNEEMVIYRNDSSFATTESTITISTKGYAIVAVRQDATNPTIVPSDLTLELRVYDVNMLNSIEDIIDSKLSDVDEGMPDYWKTYMSTKILDVRNKDVLVGSEGDSFMFITDIHISADNEGRKYNALISPAVMKYIAKNSGTRWVVNGGDTIELYTGSKTNAITGLQMWQSLVYGLEEYCTPGNHDSNNYNGTNTNYALNYHDFYAIMDRPIERIINTGSQTYFCMDNESQKIRYIFAATDLYDNLANQIAWFKSALTEKDSTWTVLVIQHKLFNDNNTGYHNQAVPFINAINDVYANIQATFIGVLAGHTHIDYSAYESINGYALISTTCDAWRLQASAQGLTRTPGTYTEQAFDVVHISKLNETVYLTRIGAGSDRVIPYRA